MASFLTASKSPLTQGPDPILADILEEILAPMGLLGCLGGIITKSSLELKGFTHKDKDLLDAQYLRC